MNNKKTLSTLAVIGLIASLATPAFAETLPHNQTANTLPFNHKMGGHGKNHDFSSGMQKGNPEEMKKKMDEKMAQDVKDEKITQAQADQMKQDHKARQAKELESMAKILGTTPAKLEDDRKAGKTLDETITSLGLNKDTVKKVLHDAREQEMQTRIKEDLASGKITQVQLDTMTARKNEMQTKQSAAFAKALGISESELKTLLDSGKTFDQIITDKGLDKNLIMKQLHGNRGDKKGIMGALKNKLRGVFSKTKTPITTNN